MALLLCVLGGYALEYNLIREVRARIVVPADIVLFGNVAWKVQQAMWMKGDEE
jgi:hypothetical protein